MDSKLIQKEIERELSEDTYTTLNKRKLLRPLISTIIVENLIKSVKVSDKQKEDQLNAFWSKNSISGVEEFDSWLELNNENKDEVMNILMQPIKVHKFCIDEYSSKAEQRFLERKLDLDEAVYSLIRITDPFEARELHMQIQEKEEEFSNIAKSYSQGIESRSCGIVGPTPISSAHPQLAEILRSSKEGELREPMQIGNLILIVRVEKHIAAVFDERMKDRMCKEMFNEFVQEEIENQIKLICKASPKAANMHKQS